MIKEIEKPLHLLTEAVNEEEFFRWWVKNVEPINEAIRNGVEVYSHITNHEWFTFRRDVDKYKALLVGITEIKQETAEDVLRDLEEAIRLDLLDPLLERAKAVLERGEK